MKNEKDTVIITDETILLVIEKDTGKIVAKGHWYDCNLLNYLERNGYPKAGFTFDIEK